MDWYQSQDTFAADLDNGAQARVVKGSSYPASHELVKRDIEWAAKAAKAGIERPPLFRKLDTGEEEPAPPPKSRLSRKASS